MLNKKKLACLLMTMLALMALVTGCAGSSGKAEVQQEKTLDQKVDDIVASMSYKEKIGQMVMIGIHGTDVNDDSKYMLNNYHIGGVTLFDRNLTSEEQTQQLTKDLQATAKAGGQKVPLFIGVDEEGGQVVRGKSFIEPPPSQRELGAGETTVVEDWADKTAKRLKALGINVNFAPVADVGSGAGRSYSDDADKVAICVKAAAQGYEANGELFALKHFPGIGKGTVDSHQEVSSINASKETLEQEDLLPFRNIIEDTPAENFMVMVSHLKYPALDADHSASQSKAIMTDLLRGDMHYDGIIITDDMEMGAVANHESFKKLGVNAIEAGADIVLICHEYEHEQEIYEGILEAYENGEISEERLNESVRRIVKAKLSRNMALL